MIETLVSLMGRENIPPVPQRRSSEVANMAPWLADSLPSAWSGIAVNEVTALNYSAVLACIRVLSETLGCLPVHIYRSLERGREKATGHYAWKLLHEEPNPNMPPCVFWENLMGDANRWGNAFAFIDWNNAGRPRALWPLYASHMAVKRKDRQVFYEYRDPSSTFSGLHPAEDILHFRTIGDDLTGWSPIRLAREAIGTGMAASKFGAKLFANGAKVGGILQVPGKLKDKAQFNADFNKAYGSVENAQKTLVIDDGAKFLPTSIPPDDAQFLETRKFQRSEIASIYRVPPHLIGDLERATFSNIEHQSLEFVQYSMLPWITRFEQELNRKLLGGGYFCRFLIAALLRGDQKSRYEAYRTGILSGFLSQDDIREMEEMNPIPGGDVYRMQMQMVPLTGGQTQT
jgi:HK97 family phage portal protein